MYPRMEQFYIVKSLICYGMSTNHFSSSIVNSTCLSFFPLLSIVRFAKPNMEQSLKFLFIRVDCM